MELELDGKCAWITGGSLGIGRAIAEGLAREGVNVAITARDPARLADAADAINAAGGGRAIAVPGNTGEAADIEGAARQITEQMGGIDILVNNAGDIPSGSLMAISDETWQESFDVKLMGYIRCIRAVLPDMRARGWGRIINIIGGAGEHPTARYIAGSAMNAAVMNLTKALAQETGPDGVLCVGINPGPVETARWDRLVQGFSQARGISPDEVNRQTAAGISVRRIGAPADIANTVLFLCSDRASFINGTVIPVDGGPGGGL